MEPANLVHASYHRNSDYTGRMPSPPQIIVPPPAYLLNHTQLLIQKAGFVSGQYPFLGRYDWDDFASPLETFTWKYEFRRTAQQILPFLFVGPLSVGRDQEFLVQQGITMIVVLRHPRTLGADLKYPSGALRMATELGIELETIEIASNQALIASFPEVIELLNKHLGQLSYTLNTFTRQLPTAGRVLIVCETGNERSPAVAIAYIMQVLQLNFVDALQMVSERRFCANIDDSLRHVLCTYLDILQAKQDVMSADHRPPDDTNSSSNSTTAQDGIHITPTTLKRAWEVESDEDMDDDDMLRFQDRKFNPFTDGN